MLRITSFDNPVTYRILLLSFSDLTWAIPLAQENWTALRGHSLFCSYFDVAQVEGPMSSLGTCSQISTSDVIHFAPLPPFFFSDLERDVARLVSQRMLLRIGSHSVSQFLRSPLTLQAKQELAPPDVSALEEEMSTLEDQNILELDPTFYDD